MPVLIAALLAVHIGAAVGGKALKLDIRAGSQAETIVLKIVNTGKRPVQVWADTCSWGYESLYLEAVGHDGRVTRFSHTPVSWRKDYPQSWHIPAGGSHEVELRINSADWVGFRSASSIRIVLDTPASAEARKGGVWTGSVKSNTLAVK